jgi:hypothetical protein
VMGYTHIGRDLTRRFTATPRSADLRVMGRTIRLETNSATVLEQARRVLEFRQDCQSAPRDFLWRVVVDTSSGVTPPWPERFAFSDDGLRYINLGQRSFIAVDLGARESVGFLSEQLAEDPTGMQCPFFSNLLNLTSPVLGLTEIAAACVAREHRCLLLFGPPKSGKTTSAYLSTKLGLRFHADQEVFLDYGVGSLIAWGDPWPAVFRWDVLERLPELRALARPFNCCDISFLYVEKNRPYPAEANRAVPTACIFLERGASGRPKLMPVERLKLAEKLGAYFPFRDDQIFEARRRAVLAELANLPAFRLIYSANPYDAACMYADLLNRR